MKKLLTENVKWHLAVIVDTNNLPGQSIYDMLQHLLKIIDFEFVVMDYISASSNKGLLQNLTRLEYSIVSLKEVLPILLDISQFDWGDFYLFKHYPHHWINLHEMSYPQMTIQCDTLVRAVDDQYIYLYTPYTEIIDVIKNLYILESIKTDDLENLDYPE